MAIHPALNINIDTDVETARDIAQALVQREGLEPETDDSDDLVETLQGSGEGFEVKFDMPEYDIGGRGASNTGTLALVWNKQLIPHRCNPSEQFSVSYSGNIYQSPTSFEQAIEAMRELYNALVAIVGDEDEVEFSVTAVQA